MRICASLARAAAILAGLGAPSLGAQEALDTSAFESACNAKPEFLDQVGGDREGLGRFCTCMVSGLVDAQVSQSDVDMLTADIDGSATDQTRMAYETYEDLRAFAGETFSLCLQSEGFMGAGGR